MNTVKVFNSDLYVSLIWESEYLITIEIKIISPNKIEIGKNETDAPSFENRKPDIKVNIEIGI